MQHESMLRWALSLTIWMFLLSITLTGLTAAYWIIGDFVAPRYTEILPIDVDSSTVLSSLPIKMIEYVAPTTDATIVSACVGWIASIVAFLAWYKLRRSDMDNEFNLPRRRFWVGSALITTLAAFASALASLVLHFTEVGPDDFGCTVISDGRDGELFYCTREIGACKVLPGWKNELIDILSGGLADHNIVKNPQSVDMTCQMTRAVKWMQVVLMVTALSVGGLFLWQAIVRRKTRYQRVETLEKGKAPATSGRLGPETTEGGQYGWRFSAMRALKAPTR